MELNQPRDGAETAKHCARQYQSIFETAAAPIFVWDEDYRIRAANPSASRFLGYTVEELSAMQLSHIVTSNELELIPERVKILLEQGSASYATVFTRKDGRSIQLSVSASRIDWDGRAAFCSIGHLPPELEQDNLSLVESEARFRAITDSTKDAIIMMDENGLVSLWNPAAEKIFGYTAAEAIGRNLHAFLAPSRYHRQHAEAFRKFQLTGEGNAINSTLELHARHKTGHEIAIELSLSSLRILGTWHTIGIVRDITERKKAEEELRESEERFRVLHDASFGGIAIHNQGVIIDCNQGLSEISGYSRDELIGMDGLKLIAPDWRPLVIANIRSGFGATYDVEGLRKDSTTYPLSIRGGNIPYKGIEVRVTEFRDITERRQAEKERRRLEAQLMQAQKMEAIGTLAGGVAHDFNNILSAILGNVDLARNLTPAASPAAGLLDKALKAIHRATSIVKQILAFSRQEETKLLPLQVVPVIVEAVKLLRPLLPSTIHIVSDIQTDLKQILADPTQIHQVVMNLCTNAFHAMEPTGGTLTLSLENAELSVEDLQQHPELTPGSFVILSIGDTGPGIPAEVRERIFDPYFTTKGVGKGTGMGLAIVHGIVKNYGGFITVESGPGQGTRFHVHLPAVEHQDIPESVEDQVITGGNERILLVDDEEIVADMSRSVLEHLGYTVTVFTNSVEAFSVLKNAPSLFDIVITDQTMPTMTGCDLAERILAIRPDMPIIICTGYSSTVSAETAEAMGVRGLAMKPLAIKDIAALIRKALDE